MKKSVMNVKYMIDTYVEYGLDCKTWEMFYNMRCHNLISDNDWMKFANTCSGWAYDDNDGLTIIDANDDCKVVYRADEQGFWIKVK